MDTGREVLGPQLAIPVPLLAVRLRIPTCWSAHDPLLSSFYLNADGNISPLSRADEGFA